MPWPQNQIRSIMAGTFVVFAVSGGSLMALALDTCNKLKVSGNVSCLNPEQLCHDSGPDNCDLAGSRDPNNCKMAANRGVRNTWNCIEGGGAAAHCLNNGAETYCNEWYWCYCTNANFHCTQSTYQCNLPQTLNRLATSGNPCTPGS